MRKGTTLTGLIAGLLSLLLAAVPAQAQTGRAAAVDTVRLKDLGRWQGWRENALIGYGIVTGLAGTGDSPGNRATRQALANALSQFNLNVAAEQVQSRNVAVVMVTASIPPFAREGDQLDVSVSSAGDARSLLGGALLLTPLKAANGRTYALAQGALTVGGYRHDANGNVVQKNHPTVGAVPGGAVLEIGLAGSPRGAPTGRATFVLNVPDNITATRAADAINQKWGESIARAVDASGIEIEIPEAERGQLVAFLARTEAVAVEPDQRARVVINERTGTLIAGGDVRISKVTVSHGELRVTVAAENQVSQPLVLGRSSPAVRTEVLTNSRLDVDEGTAGGFLMTSNTVADLVQSLARTKTHTRDVISILRAIKAAGALHADLIVQ